MFINVLFLKYHQYYNDLYFPEILTYRVCLLQFPGLLGFLFDTSCGVELKSAVLLDVSCQPHTACLGSPFCAKFKVTSMFIWLKVYTTGANIKWEICCHSMVVFHRKRIEWKLFWLINFPSINIRSCSHYKKIFENYTSDLIPTTSNNFESHFCCIHPSLVNFFWMGNYMNICKIFHTSPTYPINVGCGLFYFN